MESNGSPSFKSAVLAEVSIAMRTWWSKKLMATVESLLGAGILYGVAFFAGDYDSAWKRAVYSLIALPIGLIIVAMIQLLWAWAASPRRIFYRQRDEIAKLKARCESFEFPSLRIWIDTDPVYMGNTRGWAIRVRNKSQKAAVVSAEIIAADPPFTNHWLALPVRLRVTNQTKACSQIDAGPDSAALFDLCMIWPDKVIITAAVDECETARVPYVLTVRAFPADGPADECRFRVLIDSAAGPNVVRF